MASRAATVASIRAEWAEETGDDPGATKADAILDGMCAAFNIAWRNGGPTYAVYGDRRTAEYLAVQWRGDDGRLLRQTLRETV